MFRNRVACFVLILHLLQPLAAVAEESAFTRIPHDKKIRLAVNDVMLEGPFERFAADTLWFKPTTSGVPMAVPADSIDGLWTRGSAAGKGALIGAVVGGAAGLGLGLASESADESEFFSGANNGQSEPLLGLIAGAMGGMVLGTLFGAPFRSWHRKHP